MNPPTENLIEWLEEIAHVIASNQSMDINHYIQFVKEPELGVVLVDMVTEMEESAVDDTKPFYSACIFALEVCISQLQASSEMNPKLANKMLDQLMARIADAIRTSDHSLTFWLPVINAFYEVHVELSDELKEAYLELASEEELPPGQEEIDHLTAIKDLIDELSDSSDFDVAENFFAQSHALPYEFFSDLILDLFTLEQGHDIALLTLLHPKFEVREVAMFTLDMILDKVKLSPRSLSRLRAIKAWYPEAYHPQFDGWIKSQRMQGALFETTSPSYQVRIRASEVDGSGAQGIFFHLLQGQDHRLGGVLLKTNWGIKDAWCTPNITNEEALAFYDSSFKDTVMLRDVDMDYANLLINHFLALTIDAGEMPDLHLLELQEALAATFIPQKMDVDALLTELTIQIEPFTPYRVEEAFARSRQWSNKKRFTESWFLEDAKVDQLVNQHSVIKEGVRVCQAERAEEAIFKQVMEPDRARWLFHFLWVALWLKVKARASEKSWEDCILIAHAIAQGSPLDEIPILKHMVKQSIINSTETMAERRT